MSIKLITIKSTLLFLSAPFIVILIENNSLTVQCNQIHSINYNKRNNIDYYYANNEPTLNKNRKTSVTTNLKSILPANLAASPYGGANNGEASNGALGGDSPSIPQVANTLTVVHGNGPRRAKQIQGFDERQQTQPQLDNNVNSKEQFWPNNESGNSVCLTPGCVKAAAEILKNIDERVDPCDDFYKYSCGNWIEAQVIPEDKTSVSLFSIVQDELDNKLRNLIERETSPQDAPIVAKMRNLYESCMNTSK